MIIDTPERTPRVDTLIEDETPRFVDLSEEELDALLERIEEARTHALALSGEDYALILSAVGTLASMQEQLGQDDLSLRKLKKLLGMLRSSEKLRDLFPPDADAEGRGASKSGAAARRGSSGKGKGKGAPRNKRDRPPAAKPSVHHHPMNGLCKGDHCPGCHAGKVYKYTPAQLLRITGHSPYSAARHVSERLRCNGCQQIFTAELPAEVLADGHADQQYGYSARSLMGIRKFFAGDPYFRQQTVQDLLGGPIAASTIFDQCEKLADALNPVFRAIKFAGAQSPLLHVDDTTNRILEQLPIEKTRGGQTRLRSGVYTSACLALLPDGPGTAQLLRRIVLFQTNVGHAGEWLEEILDVREATLAPPILMSDALSSNQVHDIDSIDALCNAHGRRGFADLAEQCPEKARFALECYQPIWVNDTHCRQARYSDEQRRDYHREHSLPHLQTLQAWCQRELDTGDTEPNSNLGKAMAYFIRHFDGLSAFCHHPGAPIDNNETERVLKLIVRARKNSLFFKTAVGAEIADVITSMLATCHENSVNGFDYLNAVQRNRDAVRASPKEWLPWNYPAAP